MESTYQQLSDHNSHHHQRWLEIAQLARERGETNANYLRQVDGFVRQFAP